MIKFALILVPLATCVLANDAPSIFLPPDADIVNIVGNNFKLQVTQFSAIKNDWRGVADETSKIDNPRNKDKGSVDKNLYERVEKTSAGKVYGPMNSELLNWIEDRASRLTDKIDNYESELATLKGDHRVVVQILLLNTLVDLENLAKENIRSMRWIKNKLRAMQSLKKDFLNEVDYWVKMKVAENSKIEQSVKGTNNPGDKWMINTQAIKRVLHEQRFSDDVRSVIITFLDGKFNLMERGNVFDIYKKDKQLDDGLYYRRAKGRVPAHFPFSAQEAIVNEV